MYRPISDYALIGNCHTAALISSAGWVDWLCAPCFDSPAVFLRLLDDQRGGFCGLQFSSPVGVTRRYVANTNVLETCFQTPTGQLTLRDFMPVRRSPQLSAEGRDLDPEPQCLIRMLQCTSGEIDCKLEVKPTFEFAQDPPLFLPGGPYSVLARGRRQAMHVQLQDYVLQTGPEGLITASMHLAAGENAALVLRFASPDERVTPLSRHEIDDLHEHTCAFWKDWIGASSYDGEYSDLVLRSALALKLMIYEPTGAIIAAPTTSLPEAIGGERNWDYRFSWLRDATFTLISLMNLGYFGEARDFLHFLKRAVRPKGDLQVLFRLDGRTEADEHNLLFLDGYRRSRPVRVGNAAARQQQLDIYGELIHCLYLYAAHPETATSPEAFKTEHWPVVQLAADHVAHHWRDPDHGIWEMRGKPRHFVYSKGACWLALDRALRLARHCGAKADLALWRRERDACHDSFLHRGFNPQVGAFVQSYGSNAVDAALLRLPLMGVIDAADPKMLATTAEIERQLVRNGLVYRYRVEDGVRGDEGAFAACCFWLVDNYISSGRLKQCRPLLQHLVSFANDVGLLSEEIDPETGALLGNFPQAFTHIALLNCVLRLAGAEKGRKATGHAIAEESRHLPFDKKAA